MICLYSFKTDDCDINNITVINYDVKLLVYSKKSHQIPVAVPPTMSVTLAVQGILRTTSLVMVTAPRAGPAFSGTE